MSEYMVSVVAQGRDILLRARGHLDRDAARHLLELAHLALAVRCARVTIDLAAVHACTPAADALLGARRVRGLDRVTVAGR